MDKITGVLKDLFLNFNTGMLAFIIHRVTGIGLVIFLYLHIWTLSAILKGPQALEHAIHKFDTPFGHAFEYALLLAVIVHLVNGIRITIADFLALTEVHTRMLWYSLIICILIALPSIIIFFRLF
ncbi:MAG: succinate dehydrogenase, cytochrome b556 subunit [Candidatus Brocadiales bacterium]